MNIVEIIEKSKAISQENREMNTIFTNYKNEKISLMDKEINKQIQERHNLIKEEEMLDENKDIYTKLYINPDNLDLFHNALRCRPIKLRKMSFVEAEWVAQNKKSYTRINMILSGSKSILKTRKEAAEKEVEKNARILKENEERINQLGNNYSFDEKYIFVKDTLEKEGYTIIRNKEEDYDMSEYVSLYKKATKKKSQWQNSFDGVEEQKGKIIDDVSKIILSDIEEQYKETEIELLTKQLGGRIVNPLLKANLRKIKDIENNYYLLSQLKGISESTVDKIKEVLASYRKSLTDEGKINFEELEEKEELKPLLEDIRKRINYRKEADELSYMKNFNLQGFDKIDYLNADAERKKRIKEYTREAVKRKYTKLDYNPDEEIDSLEDIEQSYQKYKEVYEKELESIIPGIIKKETYGIDPELFEKIKNLPIGLTGLKTDLNNYQLYAVKYIINQKNAILGDAMGLGKTIMALASIIGLSNAGHTHFMVVCPASVVTNWQREIDEKTDLKVFNHYDRGIESYYSWKKKGGILLTSYERLFGLAKENEIKGTMLVVDEAHYIKNEGARRTQSVLSIKDNFDFRLFMTGTVLENRVEEMRALIRYLNPKLEATLNPADIAGYKKKVATIYLRRKMKDVLKDMPELTEKTLWMTLSGVEETQEYEDNVNKDNGFMAMRRVSWISDLSKSTKAKQLDLIIDEIINEETKGIIFSFFKEPLTLVENFFKEKVKIFSRIDGSVSSARRQELIDDFSAYKGPAVLMAQVMAGGTGLNIQAASTVIFLEPQIKPSLEEQATARSYRRGQKHNVISYRLLCADTVDESIDELLRQKKIAFANYADDSVAGKASLKAEITNSEIDEIVKSERERVALKNGTSDNLRIENGNIVYLDIDKNIKDRIDAKRTIFEKISGNFSFFSELMQEQPTATVRTSLIENGEEKPQIYNFSQDEVSDLYARAMFGLEFDES